MSLFSKLTLVIPTYQRQRYALRIMRYWSGGEVTLHVLDGSDQPIPAEEIAGLAANVNYHHMPVSIFDRLEKAGDLIQTEYAAMLGDDEFHLPDGLQACIQELETDEALVACMGRCLGFQLISEQIFAWPVYPGMANYGVPQDNPNARMIHHMNPYLPSTIYSVVRTPVWTQAMGITAKKQFSVYALGELQVELAICYQGKSKVIEDLMWLRSKENESLGDGHFIWFDKWWVDKDKSDDREEFLTLMASELSHGDIENPKSVRDGVRAACDEYYKVCSATEGRRFRKSVRTAVALRLPSVIRAQITKILAVLRGENRKSLLQAAEDLESIGVRVNFEELTQIAEIIQQFHATPTGYQTMSIAQ